jgi:HAD superfamily hydrolase (TIGR01509 family)
LSFELVIFDCDGVLVDSEPIVNGVFVQMLAEEGFELDAERTLREFSGSTMANRLAVVGRRLRWSVPADFEAAFDERLRAAFRSRLRSVAGVAEAVARLGVPHCVASNGSRGDMEFRLGLAGLLPLFEPHLFSATQVARPKPAPDLFVHAARAMRTPPGLCAVVEDSLAGVQAGVSAGMRVFGYAALTGAPALLEAGATVFTEMSELPQLLGRGPRLA